MGWTKISKIQEFISEDIRKNPELKEQYEQVNLKLDASILVREMRDC